MGGELIACEGSAQRRPDEWKRDLIETGAYGAGEGSVWAFGPDGSSRCLARGLRYPFGVTGYTDNRVLVSESWRHRVLAMELTGNGRTETVLGDLPGYPARLSQGSDGYFWLSSFAPRGQLLEFVLREPAFRRRMMDEVDPKYWVAPSLANGRSFLEPLQAGGVKQMGILKPWAPTRSYGLVVRLDNDARPVASAHSRADGIRHGTTSAVEHDGRLFVTSKGNDAVLSMSIESVTEQ